MTEIIRDNKGRFIKGHKFNMGIPRDIEVRQKISNALNQGKASLLVLPFYRNNIRSQIVKIGHCQKCGISGQANRKGNLEVHHIVPRNKGGNNELSNLMLLCRKCHKEVHKNGFE